MDSGLYAAYAGLLARTQALDVAANNLANAGTSGFRAGRQSFQSILAQVENSQVGSAVNNLGVLGASALNTAQGALTPTGNPLDVALSGTGFFSVETKNGVRYTRDGSFRISDAGELETSRGEAVLSAGAKHIAVPDGTVKIAGDGSISVASADGASAIVGKLAIVDLGEAATAAEGANLYKSSSAAAPAAANASVRQGMLEGSNEDAVTGTMQLMLLQRQTEMMQRALTVFHNDFDKVAAEELPRV